MEVIGVISGVPQGSILRPTLWNILYGEVLRVVHVESIKLVVVSSDDPAVLTIAKTVVSLIKKS